MTNTHTPFYLKSFGDKGLILFIHGFMGSPRQADALAEVANCHGYGVAALLLPGHGGTTRDFASGTFKHWQEHVDSEIERYSRDHANIWLAGHSMGGLLALNAVVKFRDNVRGVFLIGCPFKITMFSISALKLRLKLLFYKKSNPIKAAYINSCSIPLSPSLLWRTLKPAAELRKLMAAVTEILPNVNVPVTAVYSKSDEVTAIKSLDLLKSGLRDGLCKPIILPDSLHAYYPEHEEIMINEALMRLIEIQSRACETGG